MPADLPIKLDPVVLADSELKLGNDGFADLGLKGESTCLPENRRSPKGVPIFGKSVIRCLVVKELPGTMLLVRRCGAKLSAAEKLDAGGKPDAAGAARTAVRRKVGRRGKADAAGASWSVRVPFLSAFSRQLRGFWGSTADSKADGGDGGGDFRGESFERPVFAGVGGGNLARERSWRRALSGRIWR